MGEVFPSVEGKYAGPAQKLNQLFLPDDRLLAGVADSIECICAIQRNLVEAGELEELCSFSLRVLDEISLARTRSESEWRRVALDLIAFVTATEVATRMLHSSDGGSAHEWWIRSLCDEYNGEGTYGFQVHRPMLWTLLKGDLREIARWAATRWSAKFYWHSWTFGDFREIADLVFDDMERLDSLNEAVSPFDVAAVEARVLRTQWALRNRIAAFPDMAARLERIFERPLTPRRSKSVIAYFFANIERQPTQVSQEQWARLALNQFGDLYRDPETLALRIARCWARLEDLVADFDELERLTRATGPLSGEADESPVAILHRQGVQYERIAPAVRVFVEEGRSDLAMRLLAAWQGVPEPDVLQAPVLGLTNIEVGTRWAMGELIVPPVGPDEDRSAISTGPLSETVESMSAFLGNIVVDVSNPEFEITIPVRRGIPNPGEGTRFAEATRSHLCLDGLETVSHGTPSTPLVLIPGTNLPIQPLMAEALGRSRPLSISLRTPRSARALRKAVIVGDTTITSEMELDAVQRMLAVGGTEVRRLSHVDHGEFSDIYGDPDVDLIWIASHAELDHSNPSQSALHLGVDDHVELDWLGRLSRPLGDRRLLVINACEGGASVMNGGLAGFGIGPIMAGPTQSVISHLWPVNPTAAAAFGVLLAGSLQVFPDHFDAFDRSLTILVAGKSRILDELEDLEIDTSRLREHITRSSLDFSNIAQWGAPTFHI